MVDYAFTSESSSNFEFVKLAGQFLIELLKIFYIKYAFI